MKNFKELLGDVQDAEEGATEELDEGVVSRATSIFGAALITNQYRKVKAEKNAEKKIDRLAELVLISTAQIFHTLKQVKK